MPGTTSPTLTHDFIMPIDQTSSSDQSPKYAAPLEYLHFFSEGTNDGGARLKKSLPTPNWTCRIYGNHFILIFQQVNSPEELITKPSKGWHTWKQVPISYPQSDAIKWIKETTGLSQKRIGQLIGVTRQTIINWENGDTIKDAHQQRLFAVRDILERAARRYQSQAKLKAWLDTPNGTDGRTPAQLLRANEINRARLLAMATPSPHLTPVPEWVNHSIPKAFHSRSEHRQEAWPSDADEELAAFIEGREDGLDEDGEEQPLT